MDIDLFKKVNDTYGHSAGNEVLKEVARRFKKAARETDCVARYGGEEFVVLLPETSLDQARIVAERIFGKIKDEKVVINKKGDAIQITISIGISQFEGKKKDEDGGKMIECADGGLYYAKESGRQGIVISRMTKEDLEEEKKKNEKKTVQGIDVIIKEGQKIKKSK